MLEALAIVLEKKVKKEDDIYREVIKDITTPLSNVKVAKKISALIPSNHCNLPEKMIYKLKEGLKEVDLDKVDRRVFNEEREETFLEKLSKRMKMFYGRLL